jgi:hypothetical protein
LSAVARAIYEQNPCGDQEVDGDGRPIGPGYVIRWDQLYDYDAGLYANVMDQAQAAIAAWNTRPEGGPEGFVLVPLEPTEAMHNAARDWSYAKYGKPIGLDASEGCYRAMIEARPAPPLSAQGRGSDGGTER